MAFGSVCGHVIIKTPKFINIFFKMQIFRESFNNNMKSFNEGRHR